jgi:hypothetical protein
MLEPSRREAASAGNSMMVPMLFSLVAALASFADDSQH